VADMVDEPYSFEDFGEDQAFSVEDMAPPVSDFMGGSAEDYNSFIMGGDTDGALNPGQVYNIARGATATNPYPESFFSKLFGAENVDYTNILGGQGVADVNTLRARQGLGLPSLITDKSYKMGDYYIGQPTTEGVVKEVPSSGIMGLLEKVPGVSTLRNLLGRNRGLPSESERFRQAVKEAEENQINLPSLNLSDVGRNLVQNVIASKYNPFTETGPYQEGDFPEGYNLVPEKRVEIADLKQYPIPTTYLNTGIAGLDEKAMTEATASMPEKRVEIADLPQYPMTTTNEINKPQKTDIERYIEESVRNMSPEIKASMPSDLTAYFQQQLSPSFPIPTNDDRVKRDFMRDLLAYQAEQKRLNTPVRSSFFSPGMPQGMTVGDLEKMTTKIPIS
tara:strand:+ start:1493 stop:2668 length:1176 start_codon:yes stop_codon:yes gene_type:complete